MFGVLVRDHHGSRTFVYMDRWRRDMMADFLREYARIRDFPREVVETSMDHDAAVKAAREIWDGVYLVSPDVRTPWGADHTPGRTFWRVRLHAADGPTHLMDHEGRQVCGC